MGTEFSEMCEDARELLFDAFAKDRLESLVAKVPVSGLFVKEETQLGDEAYVRDTQIRSDYEFPGGRQSLIDPAGIDGKAISSSGMHLR